MISVEFSPAELKKLQDIFRRLPHKMTKANTLALIKSALLVRNDAKVKAPYKLGNLRRSITSESNSKFATVGTNLDYARVREFNTKSKPLGYLRPALSDNRQKIVKLFQLYYRRILQNKPLA